MFGNRKRLFSRAKASPTADVMNRMFGVLLVELAYIDKKSCPGRPSCHEKMIACKVQGNLHNT